MLDYVFVGIFVCFRFVYSVPRLNKRISDVKLNKFEEFKIEIPEDLFVNDDGSKIYMSMLQNDWISSIPVNTKVESSFQLLCPYRIFIEGDFCYIIDQEQEIGLLIFDISNRTEFVFVGFLRCKKPFSLFVENDIAYISDENEGLKIVDVADKNNPLLIGNIFWGDGSTMGCFIIDETYAFVAQGTRGLMIVDIRDKTKPSLISGVDTFNARSVVVDGNFAYLAEYTIGLTIVNITDIHNPHLVGPGFDTYRAVDIIVEGNLAYIADSEDGLKIVNITDKLNPTLVYEYYDQGDVFQITKNGNFIYASCDWGFEIINVTDVFNPNSVALILEDTWGSVMDVFVLDDYLAYVAEDIEGISVIDVSSPQESKEVGRFENLYGDVCSVLLDGDYLFVADFDMGFRILDVSKKYGSPKLILSTDEELIFPLEVDLFQKETRSYALLADHSWGLKIFNVTDVYNVTFVSWLDTQSARDVKYVNDSIVYVADDSSGIRVLDLSDIQHPVINSTIDVESEVLFIHDNVLFSVFRSSSSGLDIIDISDPKNPKAITNFQTYIANDVFVVENHAFVADDSDGLLIVDVSNKSDPFVVGSCDTENAFSVFVEANVAYVCDFEFGLKIIDVENKEFPIVVESIELNYAWGLFVRDNYIYVADSYAGIKILRSDLQLSGKKEIFDHFCGETEITIQGTDSSLETEYFRFKVFRGDYCNGHGKCLPNRICGCFDEYTGDQCESWSCSDVDFKVISKTCNGHGHCLSPNECDCSGGYVGSNCDLNILYSTVMTPILIIFGFVMCNCLILFCFCICLFCLFLIFALAICSFVVFKQTIGLKRFGQLKNFDLLLKEQEMEEDTSVAHLRINKSLFEIDMDELVMERILGEGGSSSVVYQALWKNRSVAFKLFKTRVVCSSQDSFNEFEREAQVLSSVSHPSILRFFGCTLKPPRIGIVMEYCPQGDLMYFLKKYKANSHNHQSYSMKEKFRWMREIIDGCEYLHQRSIIHRDLKLENVLLNQNLQCKIMDFGLSKIVDRMSVKKTKRIGTSFYMAPEIINTQTSSNYDEKCDVFSFSIMMYLIISEKFDSLYGKETFSAGLELKVANNPSFRPNIDELDTLLPKEFIWVKKIIINCWNNDPNQRNSFHDLSTIFNRNNNLTNENENFQEEEEEDISADISVEKNPLLDKEQQNMMESSFQKEIESLKKQINRLKNMEKENEILKSECERLTNEFEEVNNKND